VEFFLWLRRGPTSLGPDDIGRVVSASGEGASDERVNP
jgi:hypothetical protein